MKRVETLVIGGGQAGLAMSRSLSDLGIGHVVLERGRIGERWRSERWDSLRLLTPRWQSRLPGFAYRGPDPDGYMTKAELIGFLEAYAHASGAPVETGVTVTRVARRGDGYRVETDRGAWQAANVVIATGHNDRPHVPGFGARLPESVAQVVPTRYRGPEDLPRGGVLVVGASATGVQLAAEIHASGRPVTLAVGRHNRLPRVYRGRDILWWVDAMGVMDETADSVHDLESARLLPSLQLVGRPDRATLDLAALQDLGVRVVGRAVEAGEGRVRLAGDLEESVAAAETRLARLLARIDAWIAAMPRVAAAPAAEPVRPVRVPADAPAQLDLAAEGIRAVVWATGFRRRYDWLGVPVLDARGEIVHHEGVTAAPGLYALGLQFQRRRNSSWLDGVGRDARFLAAHIAARVGATACAVA